MFTVSKIEGYLNPETLDDDDFRWCVVQDHNIICECFTKAVATRIAKLLNKSEK